MTPCTRHILLGLAALALTTASRAAGTLTVCTTPHPTASTSCSTSCLQRKMPQASRSTIDCFSSSLAQRS